MTPELQKELNEFVGEQMVLLFKMLKLQFEIEEIRGKAVEKMLKRLYGITDD